jgi:hypothetical protein
MGKQMLSLCRSSEHLGLSKWRVMAIRACRRIGRNVPGGTLLHPSERFQCLTACCPSKARLTPGHDVLVEVVFTIGQHLVTRWDIVMNSRRLKTRVESLSDIDAASGLYWVGTAGLRCNLYNSSRQFQNRCRRRTALKCPPVQES